MIKSDVRLDLRVCHMVCAPSKRLIYNTASRKQKEAIKLFEAHGDLLWEEAVAQGYTVMKCFIQAVDKTYESLHTFNADGQNIRSQS